MPFFQLYLHHWLLVCAFFSTISLFFYYYYLPCTTVNTLRSKHYTSPFLCCVWNHLFLPSPAFLFLSPRSLFVEVMACWCLRFSLASYCCCFFSCAHTNMHTVDPYRSHSTSVFAAAASVSPWRSCLLLNPPAQKHTHSDREIGRLRLPLCLIWCYGTHRITALSKPKPICTNTHTAVGLDGCSSPTLNTEP